MSIPESAESKTILNEISETIVEYSECSTIAGIIHIFKPDQSKAEKLFWIMVVILMVILGTYWSILLYFNWERHQVITTVLSTALPISEIDFPTVTICSQGFNYNVFVASLFKLIFTYKIIGNSFIDVATTYNSLQAAAAYPTEENQSKLAIDKSLSNVWELFLNETFPGLEPTQIKNIGELSKLVAIFNHKNPDDFIKSSLCASEALEGKNDKGLLQFWLDSAIDSNADFLEFKSDFNKKIQTLDYSGAFKSFITSLWYSRLSCYDVNRMTGKSDGESSLLKKCWWKGMPIPCAAIFTTFPTDQGMCCAFNMKAADDIFVESEYSRIITELGAVDRENSFQDSTLPSWYTEGGEPVSEAGVNSGLTVILDAHNDLVEALSIDSDYEGFTATITDPREFPLTFQKGFKIKPGHLNMVALTATDVLADDDIKDIEPENRNCYFLGETSNLKLFKKYSQASCLLECKLFIAQQMVKEMNNLSRECTPWNFPFQEDHIMCDPWQSAEIFKLMQGGSFRAKCKKCLPDCTHTSYQQSLSTIPLRKCNEKNFGLSTLCNLNPEAMVPKPQIWAKQVLDQFSKDGEIPNYLSDLQSSQRSLKSSVSMQNIFTEISRDYDAYDRDIAMVSVYFDTPVALQFGTQATQSWVEFLSDVGGLLGLCIGLSIVTVAEIFWICLKIVRKLCVSNNIFSKISTRLLDVKLMTSDQINREILPEFDGEG